MAMHTALNKFPIGSFLLDMGLHSGRAMRLTLLILLLIVIVAEAGVLKNVKNVGKKAVGGVKDGFSKMKNLVTKKKAAEKGDQSDSE
ncbi:hypothetical protein GCK32_019247 [Trichostrongylus colubriformis]|uniref:Uncharacterized protein n=1 Tax=Trichostrongylus colubriformis TaxID=6319 RepID=A0AAN8FRJ5_TRICO